MTRYVLGFMFRDHAESVVLMRKLRPEWQSGLLNGVGGKIEEGESELTAMIREFHEETGVATIAQHWDEFCEMKGVGWSVVCFRAFDSKAHDAAVTKTDEKVEKHVMASIAGDVCVSNLHWLLELAIDDQYGKGKAVVNYEQ